MKLYNTPKQKLEEFRPLDKHQVKIYTCGPTVYDYPHIGNWFTFIRYDLLVRLLQATSYNPKWVINITDVGHLVSDADEGEDKLQKGAAREGKTAREIADYYSNYFLEGMRRLNFLAPAEIPRATDNIPEQIALIQKLEALGYTYVIDDGVYFDIAKFPAYADFARLNLDEQQASDRVQDNPQKHQPADFALWKFSPTGKQRDMEWWGPWSKPDNDSGGKHPVGVARDLQADGGQGAGEQRTEPYMKYSEGAAETATRPGAASASGAAGSASGQAGAVQGSWGFPGWHIECSAMILKFLGATIDIHGGGIDHIPVHHTNEIAQSEAANQKPLANYWFHANHILINDQKVAKSEGNGITLEDIEAKGYSLEAFRLLVISSHYRTQSAFSWDTLEAAANRLRNLKAFADLRWQPVNGGGKPVSAHDLNELYQQLENDLDTPAALAAIAGVAEKASAELFSKEGVAQLTKYLGLIDQLFGLQLGASADISDSQKQLIARREKARTEQDWGEADRLRHELKDSGLEINDTAHGPIWSRL